MMIAAAAVAVGSCGGRDPVAKEAKDGSPEPSIALAENAQAAAIGNATASPMAGSGPIPAALQGRWGLTPIDCQRPPGSAEGLLVVTGEALHFYESRAEPTDDTDRGEESISGNFDFTSEDTTERRFQSLRLQDGKLIRTGNGASASFTYVKCDARPSI